MKPKTWKDLSVAQFMELWDYFKDETLDDIDKQVKLLSVCLNKSQDYILDLPLAKIKELTTKCSFIGNLPSEGEAKDFWAGGYKWKVNRDITKISASDYISLTEYIKQTDGAITNLPEILYIFCKPKYYITKPDKAKCIEKLKKASIGDTYPLAVFFCHLIIHLTADTEGYLAREVKRMTEIVKKNETHLATNGDGI
jgi:hypothetical protein